MVCITLPHWFRSIGRSRYESIHLAKKCPMIVSEVGRTLSGSISPSAFFFRRACVTTAHSIAKLSACWASFCRKLSGIKSGKAAFLCPVALKRVRILYRADQETNSLEELYLSFMPRAVDRAR
jgi:hypothetical protein